ncbi:MAG: Dna2/Cas4 domain-containing protein, partial [Bacteroidales bacterium]|nr:Dna2/Cas4 domain-containing protein [Bacteroidales bacterium]
KREEAHLWQLKYYLFILENCGVENPTGILEYPRLRKTEEVYLSDIDRITITEMLEAIKVILNSEECPERLLVSRCRNCSYFDFCWSGEAVAGKEDK